MSNALDLATTQGRMKFTRPLYKELFKSPMAQTLAVETFTRTAAFYHPICRKMVAADLGLKLDASGAVVAAAGAAPRVGAAGGAGEGGKCGGGGKGGLLSSPARVAVVVGVVAAVAGVVVVAVRANKRR